MLAPVQFRKVRNRSESADLKHLLLVRYTIPFQHLRQSTEAELGDIESRSVQRSLDWPERVRRAEAAYNEEYHRNLKQAPDNGHKALCPLSRLHSATQGQLPSSLLASRSQMLFVAQFLLYRRKCRLRLC